MFKGILTKSLTDLLTDYFLLSFSSPFSPSLCQRELPKWDENMDEIYYPVQISQACLTISWVITEKMKMIHQ